MSELKVYRDPKEGPYDRNVQDKKDISELVKLCKKACDRIAKEVA